MSILLFFVYWFIVFNIMSSYSLDSNLEFIVLVGALFLYVLIHSSITNYYGVSKHPQKTANARLLSKRVNISGRNTTTNYYLAFLLETGERIEFEVPGKIYNMIIENDTGNLTYQGFKLISFTNINNNPNSEVTN